METRKKNMRRLPRFLFLMVLAACAIGASLSASAQAQNYRYRQAGSGGPVVVFEYGLGDNLETWKSVQEEVSRFTETFSYNRAGYAGSARAVGTRDAATVVGELRALLAERGLSPPYLLVGHSLGGLYMQYYARNFPNEVTGLVLVDSSHWDQLERMRRADPSSARDAARQASDLSGITREEYDAFELSGHQVRDSPPLRPMPLIVLSAGRMTRGSGVSVAFWHELQREIAAQLPQTRHTIAERSEHFIQRQQPQYVWAAVRDIVVLLRGQ
jgi:pimeloyl-ACP methyl ester carboxylesterase